MKASLRTVNDHGNVYTALMFVCPGCPRTGVHLLPVNSPQVSPSWFWDGNLEAPTLDPSILSHIEPYDPETGAPQGICHSYLRAGVFEFLSDCTHPLAGQRVPMPDLPT